MVGFCLSLDGLGPIHQLPRTLRLSAGKRSANEEAELPEIGQSEQPGLT